MKKLVKIIGILILVAIVLGSLTMLYKRSKSTQETYVLIKVEKKDIVKKTVATGKIVPRKDVQIKPQVNGVISEIFLKAGDMVKAGDVIAKVKVIVDARNLSSAESRLNMAKISKKDTKIDYDRKAQLFKSGVIAKSDFQKVESSYNQAKEELAAAEDNLEIIKNGVAKRSGSTTNTLVRSTVSGMLLDIPVKEGNSVIMSNNFNDGTTVAVVADMTDMIFQGKVDETEVGNINVGTAVEITVGALDDEKFEAVLTYVAPKGKEENGAVMFDIEGDVKLKENQFIRAGYSANAHIVLQEKKQVNTIPEGVVIYRGDSAFVMIETQTQIFEEHFVELGISDGVNVELISGIKVDSKIKGKQIKEDDKEEKNK